MNKKEEKIVRNCSFNMSLEEYMSLRSIHMNILSKGINITLKGTIKSCIDIVIKEGIKEDYLDIFEKHSRK